MTLPIGSLDQSADLRGYPEQRVISVLLVFKAAHKSAAGTGYFGGIKRKRLLLRHFYRNGLEFPEEARTAERSAAYPETAEHLCLVAHTYLTQLDTRAVNSREILYQLAEVYTTV